MLLIGMLWIPDRVIERTKADLLSSLPSMHSRWTRTDRPAFGPSGSILGSAFSAAGGVPGVGEGG